MKYEQFAAVLNKSVFGASKVHLLENLAKHPERFIGLLRPTSPTAKIVQHLCHSHESKFGDAMEELTRSYLEEHGCESLDRNVCINGKRKNLDQCFRKDCVVCFAEQKMRDDHDSTKKRGQFDDFEAKLDKVSDMHGADKIQNRFRKRF